MHPAIAAVLVTGSKFQAERFVFLQMCGDGRGNRRLIVGMDQAAGKGGVGADFVVGIAENAFQRLDR